MNFKIYKIKETVDVFISENEVNNNVKLTFHIMTTRDRIELNTNKNVARFIASFDGIKTVNDIINEIGVVRQEEVGKLIDFLLNQSLIYDNDDICYSEPRFSRQVAFWDDFVLERLGTETQSILENKKIVLFGCGGVGSKIIEILVRSGVKEITLIDYKILSSSNSTRHCYFDYKKVGNRKVDVLSDFLFSINSQIKVTTYFEKLLPTSDLSHIIPNDTDLIVNTCDEPYIGHTSLKIGRYAQKRKIPLYISGGFDAHLMSSGELIYPPYTPCIDCVQNTFSKALKGWKPVYSVVSSDETKVSKKDIGAYIQGGPGGLAMMSGFSANLSCMKLIHFLLNDSAYEYINKRIEYLPNTGDITSFELIKQSKCEICNE